MNKALAEDFMENMKKQTILCVDDDKKNLELLDAILSPMGYTLQFAESGEEALKQIKAKIPDLILLDVMMPTLSGLEVLKRLRADEKTHSTLVIIVTALRAEEDRARGLEAGCDDFISKPFEKSELVARVRSLLQISAFRSSLEEKEKWEYAIREMSKALVVCRPDWVITNFNRAAQQYLLPGKALDDLNFLDLIYQNYSVSVDWKELNDCTEAPKKFEITRKDPAASAELCLEVNLEVLENPAHEVVNIVLMFRDITTEKKKKAGGFWGFFSFRKRTRED